MSHPAQLPTIFCFFHVGEDTHQPSMLVDSIRATNPGSEIILCTDDATPEVAGITKRIEVNCDRAHLMTARLTAFAAAGIETPAIYLDTDMLVMKPVSPPGLLQGKNFLFCRRSFETDAAFHGVQRGLKFLEYDRQPIGRVFPYLACATITPNWQVWHQLLEILAALDEKYHAWYGDQEAMKILANNTPSDRYGTINESEYGCLPDQFHLVHGASILHFKGAERKGFMRDIHSAYFKSK